MSVRIYVEGGGDPRAVTAACRQGFGSFFEKMLPGRASPRVIACGGRDAAFQSFKIALQQHREAFVALLVDSEGPVLPANQAWAHLRERDGWRRPPEADNDQAHLMVQCMEAWLLADRDALRTYYGQGFIANALPRQADVEQIAKTDVERSLDQATRRARTKGTYHKTRHGFELLGLIDPLKVRGASKHAERLHQTLARVQ